ncbi:hypothetical protein BpHYR1_008762, partial [Brachionus plicatilis]
YFLGNKYLTIFLSFALKKISNHYLDLHSHKYYEIYCLKKKRIIISRLTPIFTFFHENIYYFFWN